jgi:hypothetical protein
MLKKKRIQKNLNPTIEERLITIREQEREQELKKKIIIKRQWK